MAYNVQRNIQMLIFLMKAHNIKKVIASPGATNVPFVGSIQDDDYFEIYSAPDERSAAYMACGMAAETGEPIAISCTGATASRNYIPGLTEAFYRKLPVVAITSSLHTGRIGQLAPQQMDRSIIQNDISVYNVTLPIIHSNDDEWECNIKINSALLALTHRGGGPVHINLVSEYIKDFSTDKLPVFNVIQRFCYSDQLPIITTESVGIFVGAHLRWSEKLTGYVDRFCEKYNGVVFCDHTSNYHGKYGVLFNLVTDQKGHSSHLKKVDLLIDMGEISGAYMGLEPQKVWRVSPDGIIRDRWKKLDYLFDMEEETFFEKCIHNSATNETHTTYYDTCKQEYDLIHRMIPELPFSNAYTAYQCATRIPENSIVHLGILNSLRNWNYFEFKESVCCYCNTGGFGIDGILSTVIGSSIVNNSLHFCILGDLAFFYDLNSLGNRHVPSNCRIMLINNGCGQEFKNYTHIAADFGDDTDRFIAAKGHYGSKSPDLIRHFSEDLGYEYLAAHDKSDFVSKLEFFLDPLAHNKPMIFEVFTNSEDENEALKLIHNADTRRTPKDVKKTAVSSVKNTARNIIGGEGIKKIKRIIKP